MIGPRGEGCWHDSYFDPELENKQENPPALYEPKTLAHRLAIAEMRAKLPPEPNGWADGERRILPDKARQLAAAVILDENFPADDIQATTGEIVAAAFRQIFGKK